MRDYFKDICSKINFGVDGDSQGYRFVNNTFFTTWFVFGIIFLIVCAYFVHNIFVLPYKQNDELKPGPLLSSVTEVRGTIIQIGSTHGIIKSDDGFIYHMRPQTGQFKTSFLQGALIVAKVLPYRLSLDGEYRSLCLELKKVN